MICIKRILPLILCLLLVSCSKPVLKNPLAEKSATGIFVSDGTEYPVTVLNENGAVTVIPDKPEGYSITFTQDGSSVSFDGITLDGADGLSRFYPLYEMALGINTEVTKTELKHSNGCTFK
ncbi:MAG: hypothetical protein IKV53_06395 [Clostridia bacterium]|nr:hypothetical protein [Clostridia bacterium]